MSLDGIGDFGRLWRKGRRIGLPSICTAHPLAIEAALQEGRDVGASVLIEATCNQVNQHGGYTGMTPADFRHFVERIADRAGFDRSRLMLGGDHLGPNPWKHRPAAEAMAEAGTMVDAFVRAGFGKLHLDTSMGCLGEPPALDDAAVAARAAELARIAEAASRDIGSQPVYVIGTEVPVPGGAAHALYHVEPTTPEAALRTVAAHRDAFRTAGVENAFDRVIAVVVQPGVEFGHADVIAYDRARAAGLAAVLSRMPALVFEAHSTDYQSAAALAALVEDGFAILKVGPWLTFALREVLYGLDAIAQVLAPVPWDETLQGRMERLMQAEPASWHPYYHGDTTELRVQRHFSYSDRIRYYWPHAEAQAALASLTARLEGRPLPTTLISQYLPQLSTGVASGAVAPTAQALQVAGVRKVLDIYRSASMSH